ncbi:MAG: MFS transporter [Nevskiaceae bacterium]|jgi:predicted MFS family arabinose efflux permease|nr:MFS transporter [Nevskiaceae bacterium]
MNALAGHPLLSDRYRTRFLVVLSLVCFFNLADRTLFSVLAPLIRVDLNLSDTQIGLLQGLSFALLYGGLGIPIGRLAERYSRVGIISIATAFWSLATILSGAAMNFTHMLLARIGIGMGEAGFMAPTSSLIADHFPPRRRATAMSLVMLGLPLGAMIGAIGVGFIGQRWGWRVGFVAFGIPGLLMALLVRRLLTDPPRGLVDGRQTAQAAPVPPLSAVLSHLWATPTLRWIVIGGGISAIGIQGVAQFMALYFVRNFHMPIGSAAALFGTISGLSLSVGLLAGGIGTDRASGRDPRWWVLAPAIALVVSAVAFNVGFRSPSLVIAAALIALGCVGAMIQHSPTTGLIQNLTPVTMRSSAAAVYAMLTALAGTGIGPTFVGFASDRFGARVFGSADYVLQCRPGQMAPELAQSCANAAQQGLVQALAVCMIAYAVAAVFYWLASLTLRDDLQRVETSAGATA